MIFLKHKPNHLTAAHKTFNPLLPLESNLNPCVWSPKYPTVYTSISTSLSSPQTTLPWSVVCWPIQPSFFSLNKPRTSQHKTSVSAFLLHEPPLFPRSSLSYLLSVKSHLKSHHHPSTLHPITLFPANLFSEKSIMHIYFCLCHLSID